MPKYPFRYFEDLMVDPTQEITPGMVIAETLSKFCFQPLQHLGSESAKFINNFYSKGFFCVLKVTLIILLSLKLFFILYESWSPFCCRCWCQFSGFLFNFLQFSGNIPVVYHIPATAFFLLLLVIILFAMCGYGIDFPLWMGGIRPIYRTETVDTSELDKIRKEVGVPFIPFPFYFPAISNRFLFISSDFWNCFYCINLFAVLPLKGWLFYIFFNFPCFSSIWFYLIKNILLARM